jgi:hypothetical protein
MVLLNGSFASPFIILPIAVINVSRCPPIFALSVEHVVFPLSYITVFIVQLLFPYDITKILLKTKFYFYSEINKFSSEINKFKSEINEFSS